MAPSSLDRVERETADEVDALVGGWKAAGMDPDRITILELGKRIARLNGIMEQALRADLAEIGLNYTEFDVLAALRRAGPPYRLKPSELSRALFLTSGGTSNVLLRLTASGLVEREDNPGDARSRWVQLTGKGREVAAEAMAIAGRTHAEVMRDVPPEDLRKAADALRNVLAPVSRRRR
jgi:DNA-binding MarR family transcriptional regulator